MVDTNKTAVRDWWNPEELHDQAEDDKDVAITARFAERIVTRKLAPRKPDCHQRTGKNGFGSGGRLNHKKLRSWFQNISRSNLPNKKNQNGWILSRRPTKKLKRNLCIGFGPFRPPPGAVWRSPGKFFPFHFASLCVSPETSSRCKGMSAMVDGSDAR